MTNKTMHKGFKSLISLLAVFVLSLAMLFVTACTGNDDGSSSESDSSSGSSTTTVTDSHTLINGNFEYYAESDSVTFPYSSSIRWTNSRGYIVSASSEDYAPSSTAKSGIISTGEDAYKELLDTKFGSTDDTLEKFLKKDDDTVFNPHSPSYYGYTEKDADIPESSAGDRVLMIHNRVSDSEGQGTAQYYYSSSSTLSLSAGEYGKLTVWVNTYGLVTEMVTDEFGAYVKLVNKTGSSEAAPLYVKNINTDGQWAKVEIYLEAGKLSSSSYTVYLGLGLGSANVCAEYAEGFAFFDDVTFDTIEEDEYLAGTAENVKSSYSVFTEDASETTLGEDDITASLAGTVYIENSKENSESYTSVKYVFSHAVELDYDGKDGATDPDKFSLYEKKVNSDAFKDPGHQAAAESALASSAGFAPKSGIALSDAKAFLGEDDKVLFDDSDKFVYFDFEVTSSSVTATLDPITVPADGRLLVTFWAKTSVKFRVATGLTVTVRDRGEAAANIGEDSYKTTDVIASVTEINSENNGWKQYSVLIQNTAKKIDISTGIEEDNSVERTFDIVVTFGPTDTRVDDPYLFPQGYALVGDFEYVNVSEKCTSIFNVSNTVSLSAEIVNTHTESDGTYSLTGRKGQIESGILTQPLSIVQPYGTNYSASGIFNTQYYTNDINGVDVSDITAALETDEGNDHIQALAIGNAIGYFTDKYTLPANSLAKITVKLAVFGGATAHVNVLDRNKTPSGTRGYDILGLDPSDIKTENLISDKLEDAVEYSYEISGAAKENKWITVTFYVKAGTEEMSFSVEIGNYTSRYDMWDATQTASGIVVVNSVDVSTSDYTTVDDLEDSAELEGYTFTRTSLSYRTDSYDIDNKETPVTTEIGGETENVTAVTDDDLLFVCEADDEYIFFLNYLSTNFEDKVYVTVTTDEETEDETSSDTSSADDSDALPTEARWLYISSIVIALALIVVLLMIIIRYFVKKYRAKHVKTVSYYDRDARERANEKIRAIKAKRAEKALEEAEEETSSEEDAEEYDYDAAANIEETTEEETAEEEEVLSDNAEETSETVETEEAPVEETTPEEEPAAEIQDEEPSAENSEEKKED